MSQSIITLAFEQYKAQQEALSQPIELNEFVFAYIPQQDPNVAIDRHEGLPDEELIVFTHAVTQTGYVNGNAVVYSLTMGTEVGDFEFNWMGLRNKASGVIAAISHLPTIVKTKTIIGEQDGNAMTRSIMMNYSNAQRLTGIHVDASTWQIDYTARLFGIDERERLANLDHYGDAAFLTTGFKVVKVGEQYHVTQGQGYVGGLRCSLAADFVMASVLPSSFIYVDASWQGTITSQWQTVFNITASTSQLTDYRDANGVQHYVANIAQIKANGEVIDTRYLGGTPAFERVDNAASDADVDQGLSVNKHIKLPQLWRSLNKLMSGHKNETNPHSQYERVDNAASDADVDQGSIANKHLKLPQLWRSLNKLMSGHKNETNPHSQYERVDNAASDADVDQGSTANKHLKLPQLWRSLNKLMNGHKNEVNPHAQYLLKTEKASLTTNDGYGNANVTFNHRYGVSDIEGSAGRITCATDNPSAQMNFQLADGVAEGQTRSLIDIFLMKLSGVYFKKNIFAPNILEKKYTQFAPWDSTRIYKTGEVCTVEVGGEVLQMQMYAGPNMTCTNKNPADESNRHEKWPDPSKPFWWIPYTGTEVGTPFWWLSETPPESAIMEVNANLPTVIYWRLARRYPELTSVVNGIEVINTGEIRGEFLRVLDQGRGVDVGRKVNTLQADAMQGHKHSLNELVVHRGNKGAFGYDKDQAGTSKELIGSPISDGVNGTPRTSFETRPRNIARAMAIAI